MQDGRIVTVEVFDPAVYTLSDIHIGSADADVLRAYPNAQVGKGIQLNRAVRVVDARGREILFYEDTYDTPGRVGPIVLPMNHDVENIGSC